LPYLVTSGCVGDPGDCPFDDPTWTAVCVNNVWSWRRNYHDWFYSVYNSISAIYDAVADIMITAAPDSLTHNVRVDRQSGVLVNKRNMFTTVNDSCYLNVTSTNAVGLATSGTGRIDVLINDNTTLKYMYYNGSNWSSPVIVLTGVQGPPSMTSKAMGCLDAVIFDNSDNIKLISYSSGSWSLSSVPTIGGWSPSGFPLIVATSAIRFHILDTDDSGKLHHIINTNGSYANWTTILGASLGDVRGCCPMQGQIDLIGQSFGGGAYMHWNGTNWSGKTSMFTNLVYPPSIASKNGYRIFYTQHLNGSQYSLVGGSCPAAPFNPNIY